MERYLCFAILVDTITQKCCPGIKSLLVLRAQKMTSCISFYLEAKINSRLGKWNRCFVVFIFV